MVASVPDIWKLVKYRPEIDPDDLASAVEATALRAGLDYRTRLLIRDSVDALGQHWGQDRLRQWLGASPSRPHIEAIWKEEFERSGFPSIGERLLEKTEPDEILGFLRELGSLVRKPTRIDVGGSTALILPGLLSRATDDVDVVDEVPAELRSQHRALDEMQKRYGLKLAHFQSHYLVMRWQDRVRYLDTFGDLRIYLLDPHDVFLSKLFSIRSKDLDDMRALKPQLDRERLARILKSDAVSALAAESLRQRAEKNWFILFGEALPS